jgi:hypothetical protein
MRATIDTNRAPNAIKFDVSIFYIINVKIAKLFVWNFVHGIYTITANIGSYTAGGGLRAVSSQDEKQPGRKDAHRKPLLPHLTG